ncbi:hypothetical protein JW796_01465 [Candidatus Dojkabacteria bacterium]|nr:hypothetical protein [Candidatus Dojkabacteria bacterium]
MGVSVKSHLSMRYDWDDNLVEKMIRAYGEEYLSEREEFYESLEDSLEDHQVTLLKGATLYCINKNIIIVRMHGGAVEYLSKSVVEIFENMRIKVYASGLDTSLRINWVFDTLEIEAVIKLGKIWHKQFIGLLKFLPQVPQLSSPDELVGEIIVVGKSESISEGILSDIFKGKGSSRNDSPVKMEINSIRRGVEYLKQNYSCDACSG